MPDPDMSGLNEAACADPDTRADVDFMILDYLTCTAISSILSKNDTENLAWTVDTVRAFHKNSTAILQIPPPQDLKVKLQTFELAYGLFNHDVPLEIGPRPSHTRLSKIGVNFMDLCTAAGSIISETSWFDIGAQFQMQAVLEDTQLENDISEDTRKFLAWAPADPELKSKWTLSCQNYWVQASNHHQMASRFPIGKFRATVTNFLIHLMTKLDAPILIQLERGKLFDLSREETQALKERVGLR